MMKKYFTKEVQIALAVIMCGIIIFVGIDYLKGINILKPTNYYYVSYKNVSGLAVSTPVTIDGFKTGLVRAIEYDYNSPGNILVEISLDNKLKLPKGSKVVLSTDFLGTATLQVKLNSTGNTYHVAGDTIEGENATDLMSSLQNKVLPQLETMLPRIDSILTGIQAIVTDPALKSAVGRLDNITANLEQSSKNLSVLMRKDIPGIVGNVSEITSNLNHFSSNIKDIDLAHTVAYTDSTIMNLHDITTKLNSKDNTLGLLLNDGRLYDGLTKTVLSGDSLLIDLRQHPKRYVHFSLFGKKEKK